MIINLELERDQRGKIKSQKAEYRPSDEVKERTAQVMHDFATGDTIRGKIYTEFNDTSLRHRISMDQRSFNQYVRRSSDDPAQAWRSTAFRPIVRNKIISIAANITASLIFPKVFAQNDDDQEDRDAAQVMRGLMEWAGEQAKYEETFLYAVLGALINPATIIHTEYAQHFRKVKELQESTRMEVENPDDVDEEKVKKEANEPKKWQEKTIVDELFSGFKDTVVPVDELWIADIYEGNIQKQPFLIWRRILDFTTAKAKYWENQIFSDFVKPGIQFLYDDEQGVFYEQYDEDLEGQLVEEVIYYNRTADLQLTFVNGILLDDVDNPNPRRDKNYPFVKTGYETFDEGKFFYYKSLAFKLTEDERVVNTAYRMVADGTYLSIMPPAVMFGNEEVGSSVIMPGAVTNIDLAANPNAAFQPINTGNNLSAAYSLLDKFESSITESSASTLQSGGAPVGATTAFEISRIEQSSRVLLGLFGKMIGFMVRDLGQLRISDILQFLTVGEVADISSEATNLKFGSFLLPDKIVQGRPKTRKIEFDMELPDEVTEAEMLDLSARLASEQRELGDKVEIMKVNPRLFRAMKFKVKVIPDVLLPQSAALKKAQNLEAYNFAVQNPLSDLESVTRELLFGSFESTKDDPDRFMKEPAQPQELPGTEPAPAGGGVEGLQLQAEREQLQTV